MNQMLSVHDLQMISNEPRVLDLRIAERLEMAQPLNIRQVVEANRAELETYGEVFMRAVKTGPKGGRPGAEFWLNEPQTLLVCMFSKTDAAAAVRREVISVYMAFRQGQGTKGSSTVTMEFTDYSAVMKSLIAAVSAQDELLNIKRTGVTRDYNAEAIRILIVETTLSDEAIAEKMCHILGRYVPELVAMHRRKMMDERTTSAAG